MAFCQPQGNTRRVFMFFILFFIFLKGITQVGDYTAARNGNWPDFANGATILQQAGCRPKHLCGEHSTRCTSHSWPLCVSLFGKDLNLLNFEPKDHWLNLKMMALRVAECMCLTGGLVLLASWFFFFFLMTFQKIDCTHACSYKVAHDHKMMVHVMALYKRICSHNQRAFFF